MSSPALPSTDVDRFASKSFAPATTAAELAHLQRVEKDTARTDLLKYREQLEQSLSESVPEWPEFRAIVEGLSTSLMLTQHASSLSTDVRDLAVTANDSTRPQTIIAALNETDRVAADLRLLEQVKAISVQMRELRERDVGPFVSEHFVSRSHSVTTTLEHSHAHLTRSSALDPRSLTALQPDYVGRAKELADLRTSALRPHLLPVQALNPARAELEERHRRMRAELETLLLHGVYGVPESPVGSAVADPVTLSAPKSRAVMDDDDDPRIGQPFLPPMPLFPSIEPGGAKPSPLGFAELGSSLQEALPQVVEALDTLCETGHACNLIEKTSTREAQAVIEHAVRTEIAIAKAAAVPEAPAGKELADNTAEQSRSSFFHKSGPSESERMCCAALNRICFHFAAVLRRMVGLANSLQRDSISLFSAISLTREQMDHGLILVLNKFLSEEDSAPGRTAMQATVASESENSFSLLNGSISGVDERPTSTEPGSVHPRYCTFSEMERKSPLSWNIRALHELPENMSYSIFNLELAHSVLKRFSRESERLLAPWYGFGKDKGRTSQAIVHPLDSHLHSVTGKFVETLTKDLRLYVRSVVGKRVGSLLQPPPSNTRNRNSQTEHKPSPLFMPSRHVEPIAQTIAVCLRIAISVPDIAKDVGSVVSSEVLCVLKERSNDAASLVRKWTDADSLVSVDSKWTSGAGFEGSTTVNTPSSRSSASSDSGMIKKLRSVADGLVKTDGAGPTLLSQNEWKAVVRLIQGLNLLTGEMQKWCTDSKLSEAVGLDPSISGRWSDLVAQRSSAVYPLQQLRQRIRQVSSGTEYAMLGTLRTVLGRLENSLVALNTEVIAPCIALLRAEVMLRCFWLPVRSMREIELAFIAPKKSPAPGGDMVTTGGGVDAEDESSSRLFEFDEYGDRIPQGSDSGILQRSAQRNEVDGESSMLDAQSLTKAEHRMVSFAKSENENLAVRLQVTTAVLSARQQRSIFAGVDVAVAEGLRSVRRKDRAIAVASRMLVQTLALEELNLIGDRTSEQCRALMYASGML